MHLIENAELISRRVKLLDHDADLQLVRELMELHEDKCRRCQEDRLSCTITPSCHNRNFLNALIEAGLKPRDLPSYCYNQYLIQIRRYIIDRKGRDMEDRRIPIKDLLTTLKMSSIRQFTTNFTKRWKRHARVREGDILLVAGDDLFFHFDFTRGIVEIDPWDLELREFHLFGQYVRLLSAYYDVGTELLDATVNWWILTVDLGQSDSDSIVGSMDSELQRQFDAIHVVHSEDSTALQVEVVVEPGIDALSVGALRRLFSLVSEARKS